MTLVKMDFVKKYMTFLLLYDVRGAVLKLSNIIYVRVYLNHNQFSFDIVAYKLDLETCLMRL